MHHVLFEGAQKQQTSFDLNWILHNNRVVKV
jgi:hypothetical protein